MPGWMIVGLHDSVSRYVEFRLRHYSGIVLLCSMEILLKAFMRLKGTSKNSEFAQMPHKGTPIRYGQKQPVRNRQQGARKFSQRRI